MLRLSVIGGMFSTMTLASDSWIARLSAGWYTAANIVVVVVVDARTTRNA